MGEQSLDTFFDRLVQVLVQDLAFYIPSVIIPVEVFEQVGSEIPERFLDELGFLDIQEGIGEFEIVEVNKRLLQKRKSLEQNIFQMLRKKKELDEYEFNYLLKKYSDQVEFYCAITDWLSTYLTDYDKEEIGVSSIGIFEIQNHLYKSHFKELIEQFTELHNTPLKPEYTISELLLEWFPDLISRYNCSKTPSNERNEEETEKLKEREELENITSETTSKTIQLETTNVDEKVKKEPLITEKEAEDFLLELVFSVTVNE